MTRWGVGTQRADTADGHELWLAPMRGEPLTYLTLTMVFQGTPVVADVLQALWTESAAARDALDRGVKVLTRRQRSWLVIEVVGPADEPTSLWDTLQLLLTTPVGIALSAAADVVATRTGSMAHARAMRANTNRWRALTGAVPPMAVSPTPQEARAVTEREIVRLIEHLIGEAPKMLAVVGDVLTEQVVAAAGRFAATIGYRTAPPPPVVSDLQPGEGGIHVVAEPGQNDVAVRLAVPLGRPAHPGARHALFAAAMAFGGSHFSALQSQLRDRVGLAYTPSAAVEHIGEEYLLFVDVDTDRDHAVETLDITLELITDFLGGGWRDYRQTGVEQLSALYASAWANARGRGTFLSTNWIHGVRIDDLPSIQASLASITPEVMADALDGVALDRIAGCLVGDIDQDQARAAQLIQAQP